MRHPTTPYPPPPSPPPRLVLLLVVFVAAGCVRYDDAVRQDGVRFDHLYRRDLPAFEQRLAAERQAGLDDAWTRVGDAWLALANCETVDAQALQGSRDRTALADVVLASLVLEDRRRRRLLFERGLGLRNESITGTVHAKLDDQGFFERAPRPLVDGPAWVVWLPEEERWADETPAQRAIASECEIFYQAVLTEAARQRKALADEARDLELPSSKPRRDAAFDGRSPPGDEAGESAEGEATAVETADPMAERMDEELAAVDALLEAGDQLGTEARRGVVARMLWRTQFHGALRSLARADYLYRRLAISGRGLLPEDGPRIEAWVERARGYLEPLLSGQKAKKLAGELSAGEQAPAYFLAALLHLEAGREAAALDSLAQAERAGLDRENRWGLRYLRLRLLQRAARWEEAAGLAEELPPVGHPLFAPYTWRAALALERVGLEDRFLALAMGAFRDRPYRADPFMRALYVQTLNTLADYVFEPRILESLEDMGPRRTMFERVEEYASIALDRGRPDNAEAAARWLLAQNTNHQYHPRYHAIAALAAFLRDDPEAFGRELTRLEERPAALREAIPEARRPLFWAQADEQFARILRQMLPVMAEWGEGPRAQNRRQRWLEVMVERTQRFLRHAPESLARPKLVELYRLASAMLEDHPRAYPERVGRAEPLPLVLGTVRVDQDELARFEPRVRPQVAKLYGLALVPRDHLPPPQWSLAWQEEEAHEPHDDEEASR